MIGGTVIKTKVLKDRVWIKCEEDNSTSQCAIYVEKNPQSLCIEPGDSVWWKGGYAVWWRGVKEPKDEPSVLGSKGDE